MSRLEVNLSDFGSERGLFRDDPAADRDGESRWDGRSRVRNLDYLRLKDFAIHLVAPAPGMRILDLGCADGAQMTLCGLQGAEVHGQDFDAERVAHANHKLRLLGLNGEATVGDARALAFGDDEFDAVLSSDFHEHISDEDAIRVNREAVRVLRPGGALVIKTPNRRYLRASLAYKRARALLGGADPRGFVIPHTEGSEDPDHVGLRDRFELAGTLEAAGLDHYAFHYAPLRRFGRRPLLDVLSTEVSLVRDLLSEDLFCRALKPVHRSWFPR